MYQEVSPEKSYNLFLGVPLCCPHVLQHASYKKGVLRGTSDNILMAELVMFLIEREQLVSQESWIPRAVLKVMRLLGVATHDLFS